MFHKNKQLNPLFVSVGKKKNPFSKLKTKIIRSIAKELALFFSQPQPEQKQQPQQEIKTWVSKDYEIDYWDKIKQRQQQETLPHSL